MLTDLTSGQRASNADARDSRDRNDRRRHRRSDRERDAHDRLLTRITLVAAVASVGLLYVLVVGSGSSNSGSGSGSGDSSGTAVGVRSGSSAEGGSNRAVEIAAAAQGPNPYPHLSGIAHAPVLHVDGAISAIPTPVPASTSAPVPAAPATPTTPATPSLPGGAGTSSATRPAPTTTPSTPEPAPTPAPVAAPVDPPGPVVPVPFPVQAADPVRLELGTESALNGLTYAYEQLPYRQRDAQWRMATTYDPSFGNGDMLNNYWDADQTRREFVYLDISGPGVFNFGWTLPGDQGYKFTYWPVIRITVDGAVVYEQTYVDTMNGLHWPLQAPSSSAHNYVAGLAVHIPIVFHSHFRIAAHIPKTVDGDVGMPMFPPNQRAAAKHCILTDTLCAMFKAYFYISYARHRAPVGVSFRTVWEQRQRALALPAPTAVAAAPADANGPPPPPPPVLDEVLKRVLAQSPDVQTRDFHGFMAFQRLLDNRKALTVKSLDRKLAMREAKLELGGEPFTILDLPNASGAITAFYFLVRALDWDGVELEFQFDGVTPAQVDWVPAAVFFGTARFGRGAARTPNPAVGVIERVAQITHFDGDGGDPAVELVAQIVVPMPFWKSARIRARAVRFQVFPGKVSTTAEPERAHTLICFATRYRESVDPERHPVYDKAQAGYFRTYMQRANPGERVADAHPVLSVPRGWGTPVNMQFLMLMTSEYLEGDFQWYWDHSRAGLALGTGVEDHFGFGHRFRWGTPATYSGFGCTAREGVHPEVVIAYRSYATESMNFNDGMRMYIELVTFGIDPTLLHTLHTAHHYYAQATAGPDAVASDPYDTKTPPSTTTAQLLAELTARNASAASASASAATAPNATVHRHSLIQTDVFAFADANASKAHNYRVFSVGSSADGAVAAGAGNSSTAAAPGGALSPVNPPLTGVDGGAFEGLFPNGLYRLPKDAIESPAAHVLLEAGAVVSYRLKLLPADPLLRDYPCTGVILRRGYASYGRLLWQGAVVLIDGKLLRSEAPPLSADPRAPVPAPGSVPPLDAAATDAAARRALTLTGAHVAPVETASIAAMDAAGVSAGQYTPADVWWGRTMGYVEKYRWSEHDLYVPLGHTRGKTEIEVTLRVVPGSYWDDRDIQAFCQV